MVPMQRFISKRLLVGLMWKIILSWGSNGAKSGIRLDASCVSNVIRNNTIRQAKDYAIWLSSGTKNNVVMHNFFGDTGAAIRYDKNDDNVIILDS